MRRLKLIKEAESLNRLEFFLKVINYFKDKYDLTVSIDQSGDCFYVFVANYAIDIVEPEDDAIAKGLKSFWNRNAPEHCKAAEVQVTGFGYQVFLAIDEEEAEDTHDDDILMTEALKEVYQLKYTGETDEWDRPLYKDVKTGKVFCDINMAEPYSDKADIHVLSGTEPSHRLSKDKYQFVEASEETMKELDGIADGYSVEDIADKHGVPVQQIEDQLIVGVNIELEHTSDEDIAYKIAMDHLFEMPDYYTKLNDMEISGMEKEALEEATAEYAKDLYYAVSDYFPDISETGLSEEEIDKFPELAIKYIRKNFTNAEIREIFDSEDNTYLDEISEEVFEAVIEMLEEKQVKKEATSREDIQAHTANQVLDNKYVWFFSVLDAQDNIIDQNIDDVSEAIDIIISNEKAHKIVALPYVDPDPENPDVDMVLSENPGPIILYDKEADEYDKEADEYDMEGEM